MVSQKHQQYSTVCYSKHWKKSGFFSLLKRRPIHWVKLSHGFPRSPLSNTENNRPELDESVSRPARQDLFAKITTQ